MGSAESDGMTHQCCTGIHQTKYTILCDVHLVADFKRPDWDQYFMLQAELAKLRSNCIVRGVGAVIAKNHRQMATGYNGTPPGMLNCHQGGCERCARRMADEIKSGQQLERCLCTHAEANAIIHCAILGIGAVSGATLYSTETPCLECSKMAITIGIRRFVSIRQYAENTQTMLKEAGVDMILLDESDISEWIRILADSYGV